MGNEAEQAFEKNNSNLSVIVLCLCVVTYDAQTPRLKNSVYTDEEGK